MGCKSFRITSERVRKLRSGWAGVVSDWRAEGMMNNTGVLTTQCVCAQYDENEDNA